MKSTGLPIIVALYTMTMGTNLCASRSAEQLGIGQAVSANNLKTASSLADKRERCGCPPRPR
jgi:hypothetical protein